MSKAKHNTDFHWYLAFLHLESLFFFFFLKQQMNTQIQGPQDRSSCLSGRGQASARGSISSQLWLCKRLCCLSSPYSRPGCPLPLRCPRGSTGVLSEEQGSSSNCPCPRSPLHSLVPNYGEFARCADPRGPEGSLGQHHRAQPAEQRALTQRTKHKQLGLKAITGPWMFSTGSLASGRT